MCGRVSVGYCLWVCDEGVWLLCWFWCVVIVVGVLLVVC